MSLSLRHGGASDPLDLNIWPALARTPCVSCCTPVSTNTSHIVSCFCKQKAVIVDVTGIIESNWDLYIREST